MIIDKNYLLKELKYTLDNSDSTAAYCLCQRWILKEALFLLQGRPIEKEPKICNYCGNSLNGNWKWCPHCGRGIDWND